MIAKSGETHVLIHHVVDRPDQFAGVEKVILELAKGIPSDETKMALAVNDGILLRKAKQSGVAVFKICASKSNFFSWLKEWKNICRQFRPDIVHSHHRYTTLVSQCFLGRGYKILHTVQNEYSDKRWMRFFGDSVVAASQALKNYFVRHYGWNPEKVSVIYDALDFGKVVTDGKKFLMARKFSDQINAVVIARLEEQKGHEYLIHAWEFIPRGIRRRFNLVFVGDGAKRGALEKMVRDQKIEEIKFAGFQEDVRSYLEEADFSILPSVWEGFGLSILESYLCGKPVIASRVGGIPEIVKDHESGILVPPRDPRALASALMEFAQNPELVKRCGRAGAEMAKQFTPAEMVRQYKNQYRELKKSSRKRQ